MQESASQPLLLVVAGRTSIGVIAAATVDVAASAAACNQVCNAITQMHTTTITTVAHYMPLYQKQFYSNKLRHNLGVVVVFLFYCNLHIVFFVRETNFRLP